MITNNGQVKVETAVSQKHVDRLLKNAKYKTQHAVFGKMTIVVCKLPSGFCLVGASACVDPDNYDPEVGEEICKKQIEDKLWELEGYKLQNEIIGA